MTSKKNAKKEFSTEKLSDWAKDLYLANLGVYGKIYESIEDRVDQYNDKSGDLFKDLVKRGEAVHKSAEKRVKDTEERIRNLELVKDMKLEDRINELKDNFSSMKDKLAGKKEEAEEKIASATSEKAPSKAKSKAKAKTAAQEGAAA